MSVTQERGQVIFSVPATSSPCIDTLMVVPADAQADLTWSVASSDSNRCLTRFAYGNPPAGFRQSVAAEPLVPGKLYLVSIKRPGATGIAYFSPGNDGPIERDPPAR